jgi:uncharacterized protein YjdB
MLLMPRHQPITIADRSLLNTYGHPQTFRSNSVRIRRVLVAVIFGVLSGCSGEKATAPVTVSSVSLSNSSGTLQYGQTVQLTASVLSSNGSALNGRPLTWSSSNDAIASISPTGLVTAGAVRGGSAETATITVTSEGRSASAAVTVAPIPAATVTLSLNQVAVYVGQIVQLGVTAKDVTGGALTGRAVTWSSATPTVATVTPQGLVTAIATGAATITATVDGKSATASVTVALVPVSTVTVTPSTGSLFVGQTLQLSASAKDSAGNALTGRAVIWSSASPTIATVTTQGLVTAIATGTVTVTATVDGKSATMSVTATVLALAVTIQGSGQVLVSSLTTGKVDTVSGARNSPITPGDSIRITPFASSSALFDAISGAVNDSLQLYPSYDLKVTTSRPLEVRFVPRKLGTKALQNAFFDTTALNYRTSENFVVWWDKRWDHNYLAKDLLRQLEEVRRLSMTWGMALPPSATNVYVNAYVHHISGQGGANIDVFDDGWGQGVGTDNYGMPFYTAPFSIGRSPVSTPGYCWCYNNPWHEGFHLMQWGFGRSRPNTFPYSGDSKWYTEATASWFERYFTLSESNAERVGVGPWNGTAAFLMQPQLRLWSPPDAPTWSVGVHAYAAELFLLYLSWNKLMPDDLIGRSWTLAAPGEMPQQYLASRIPNLSEVYRQFVVHLTALDGMPSYARRGISASLAFWRANGAKYGNALPNGENHDNTYAFDLRDAGTAGWVVPKAKIEAWAFSVTRLQSTQTGQFQISLNIVPVGSGGTPADFYAGLVVQKDGINSYSSIPIKNGSADRSVLLQAGSIAFIVVVNTPNSFFGNETFDYSIKIDRTP